MPLQHYDYIQILTSTYYLHLKGPGSLEKQLIPGLEQEKYKVNLEHFDVQKAKKYSQNEEDMLRG